MRKIRSKIEAAVLEASGDRLTHRELYGLWGPLATRTRFILLIVVTLCMMINWANILAFNFTTICMGPKYAPVDPNTKNPPGEKPNNGQGVLIDPGITFTPIESYLAQAVVAVAALAANPPIIITVNKYGPRYLFSILGMFGVAATALIPVSLDRIGMWGFYVCRAVQGAAFAGDMAVMGSVMAHWTYFKQYAVFTATLCTYVQIAPIFTNPIAGSLCVSSWGWRAVYYTHAIVAFFLFVIFFTIYRNHPNEHPWVGAIEREKLAVGRGERLNAQTRNIPYKHILKSLPFWAVVVGSIGNFSGVNLMYIGEPVFLNKVVGFKVAQTGFMAALPPLLMAMVKEGSGILNDRLTFIPETIRTKIFNSIAFFTMAGFLIVLGFIPIDHGNIVFLIMTIGYGFLGFNIGGFYKSGTMISRHYAPFVVGQVSQGITFTMLLVASIILAFNTNNTQAQWRAIFLCVAGIQIGTNIFYIIFASGVPQYWAADDFDPITGTNTGTNKVAPGIFSVMVNEEKGDTVGEEKGDEVKTIEGSKENGNV